MEQDRLITKDGIKVEIGQMWRDLDKRMSGRIRKVVALSYALNKARMQHPENEKLATWVSVRRMHKHSTGWQLI